MRYIILLVLCAWTGIALAIDNHAKDSLLLQLKQTTIAVERINIYRNLADICFETPDEKTYLLNMYREAQKAGDTSGMLNALNDLVCGETRISYGFSISLYGTDKSNPGAPRNSPCIGLPSNAIFRYTMQPQ